MNTDRHLKTEEELQARSDRLRTENLAQWEEAQSEYNRWVAGINLNHSPTPAEAFMHYVQNGGAAAFRQRRECP